MAALACAVIAVSTTPAPAGAPAGDILWEVHQVTPGIHEFFAGGDSIAAGHGAVFVTGTTNDFADIFVRAYDAEHGGLLWEDVYDHAGGSDQAIGITAAGKHVFVLGGANLTPSFLGLPLIRAYDRKTGALAWQRLVLEASAFGGLGVFDSAVVYKQAVIAVGGNLQWLVQSYDTETGAAGWGDRFGPGGNRAIDVAEAHGRLFVGGRARIAQLPSAKLGWFLRAYDAETGGVLWEDHTPAGLDFSGNVAGQVQALAVEGQRVIAVGRADRAASSGDMDWAIRTYDARTGTLLWQDEVDKGGVFPEFARDVTVLNGRAFVVGTGGPGCTNLSFDAPDNNCDFIVRAYAMDTGALLWEDQLDRAPLDSGRSITADGVSVYAIGSGGNDCAWNGLPTNCDVLVRAYDPETGELLWEDQADAIGTDETGAGVAVDGGKVFVTDNLDEGDHLNLDTTVFAYDAVRGGR